MEKATGYDNKNELGLLDSIDEGRKTFVPPKTLFRSSRNYVGMTVIPWRDIWASLALAQLRGHTQMINVFYDTLFKEALFDDRGVWSPLMR